MKILMGAISFAVILVMAGTVYASEKQESAKTWQKQANEWQKQANDTRATVMKVYDELGKMDVSKQPDAKGLIDDAAAQLKQGDKYLKQGDEAMAKQEWEKANFGYNMAWQYYVKAATAGLNAKSILTSQ